MITFTKEELKQHNIQVPSQEEIDDMLEDMQKIDPYCGSNSGSQINPNSFCGCSRENGVSPGCNAC
jgi:hypothetical protein